MTSPTLRVTTEAGRTADDPSAGLLLELLTDIEASRGADNYVVVQRLTDPTGQTYAQTLRQDDGSYLVEYRDGSEERHFQSMAGDLREAHAVLSGWAVDRNGWDGGRNWTRLVLRAGSEPVL